MPEYQKKQLKDIAVFTNGGAWNQGEYASSGIPVVRVSDIKNGSIIHDSGKYLPPQRYEKYKKHTLFKGDLVIATVGSHPVHPDSVVGRGATVPAHMQGALLNQNAVRISPADSDLDKGYLGYLGKTKVFRDYIVSYARGSANQMRMSISLLKEMELLLPPPSTQRKIASVLSAYDDLIENNTRRIEILEEMAQALYREWFVNFRFPGHEKGTMVDSSLGKIPEGWETGRLDEALLLQRGFDLPVKSRQEGSIPIYAATGKVGNHAESKVTGPGVVTGRSGTIGTVMYVNEDYWPLNTTLWVREFRRVTPAYAFFLLQELDLKSFDSGVAVPTLNRNYIHGVRVVLPPLFLIEHFDEHIDSIYSLLETLRRQNDNLRRTRDLLLPKLISGEVDVEDIDIEEEVEAATATP